MSSLTDSDKAYIRKVILREIPEKDLQSGIYSSSRAYINSFFVCFSLDYTIKPWLDITKVVCLSFEISCLSCHASPVRILDYIKSLFGTSLNRDEARVLKAFPNSKRID